MRGYVRRLGDGVSDRQATVNCRWAGGMFRRREGNRSASGRARIWVPVCALSGGTKHGVPLWGATLAPPIERRTGEASVIVAADGLTASDAVSCQLNLEHIHDRQPGSRASLRGLSRANSRYGELVSTRPTWELVSATDGPVPAADPRASRQPVFDFHARSTSAGRRSRQGRPAPPTRTGR